MVGIYVGWSCWSCWLQGSTLLPTNPAAPANINDKLQPCIPGEYVGLVFLAGSAAGIFGVALVIAPFTLGTVCKVWPCV